MRARHHAFTGHECVVPPKYSARQRVDVRLLCLSTAQRKYLDACCVYLWAATPVLTTVSTFAVVLALNPGSGASAGEGT